MIIWTDYMRYKTQIRGFSLEKIEHIVLSSRERYYDTLNSRMVAIGKHDTRVVLIPYEKQGEDIVPVTIHATTRQQINFRVKTGRFNNA